MLFREGQTRVPHNWPTKASSTFDLFMLFGRFWRFRFYRARRQDSGKAREAEQAGHIFNRPSDHVGPARQVRGATGRNKMAEEEAERSI